MSSRLVLDKKPSLPLRLFILLPFTHRPSRTHLREDDGTHPDLNMPRRPTNEKGGNQTLHELSERVSRGCDRTERKKRVHSHLDLLRDNFSLVGL